MAIDLALKQSLSDMEKIAKAITALKEALEWLLGIELPEAQVIMVAIEGLISLIETLVSLLL